MTDMIPRSPCILAIACVAAVACVPLPIPHVEQVTPAVVGTLEHEPGAPPRPMRVAAAADSNPRSCAWSSGAEVSGESGTFSLPAVHVRKRLFWFSMMENFGRTAYWICATPSDSVRSAEPLLTSVLGHVRGDSIACLEWRVQGSPRLTCDSRFARRTTTGGAWNDGDAVGEYRLILAAKDTSGRSEYRVFVQWVELSRDGHPAAVRATTELPAPAVDLYPAPALNRDGGHWNVVVKSNRPGKKGRDRFLTFELGRPGEIVSRPNS